MTATKVATSRASSARPASVARSILKQRDKPYKTEQSRIIAKKKKLNLNTTYTTAPAGFQFLPVGTPDLAERCKELSRQRGLPVNVVNAKPVSKHASDPAKVSHHIHRIGYHFRCDVVDDACQELGYTFNRGHFMRESELARQNEQTLMARAMAKHGLHLDEPVRQETDEQVRAAIKELFPKIPDDDLKAILKHAWEEGSHRVGTNTMLELPRRVQLATIARIRHTYTDYDRLLRAFEWKDARALVEPTCLKKLIEWRGEKDEDNDEELEEVVRETIVIDDDDDEGPARVRNGSEADDEDSAADLDHGYASDTSLEISHKPAAIEDIGAESHDERSMRFFERHQPIPRNAHQRYLDVRQKIGVARQQLRSAPQTAESVVRVNIPEARAGDDTIMIGGQLFRRAPVATDAQKPALHTFPSPIPASSAPGYQYECAPQSRVQQLYPRCTNGTDGQASQDRAIASIEPQDELRRIAMTSALAQNGASSIDARSRPASPSRGSTGNRRCVEYPVSPASTVEHLSRYPSPKDQYRTIDQYGRPGKVLEASYQDRCAGPDKSSGIHEWSSRHVTPGIPHGNGNALRMVFDRSCTQQTFQDVPHDPRPQMISVQRREPFYAGAPGNEAASRGFVDAQIAPIQYAPHPRQDLIRRAAQHQPRPVAYNGYTHTHPQTRIVYVEAPRASYTPQPVHGAPAPVQQLPRTAPKGDQVHSAARPRVPVSASFPAPVNGSAPAPQYYYYPR